MLFSCWPWSLPAGCIELTGDSSQLRHTHYLNTRQCKYVGPAVPDSVSVFGVYVKSAVPVYLSVCMIEALNVYMCTCVHVYMCTCVHVYMCACVHVYMCTCLECRHLIDRPLKEYKSKLNRLRMNWDGDK